MNLMNDKLQDCHDQIHSGKYNHNDIHTLKIRAQIYQESVDYWISTRINPNEKLIETDEEPVEFYDEQVFETQWFKDLDDNAPQV